MLAQAAADTLGIVADPTGSFQQLLLGHGPRHPPSPGLRDGLRYIDIDKAFLSKASSTACPSAS